MADGLRLTFEIVPGHTADPSLSSVLPKARWESIRQRVAEEYDRRCAACGGTRLRVGPLQCHEIWDYDLTTVRPPTPKEVEARLTGGKTRWTWAGSKSSESVRRGVRHLVGFLPLCGPCHRAKHSNWPCYIFPWVHADLATRGSELEPGEVFRETLVDLGWQNFAAPARTRFMEVNHGVPLAVLEAHCLEACALRDSRQEVGWASNYNGFDCKDGGTSPEW